MLAAAAVEPVTELAAVLERKAVVAAVAVAAVVEGKAVVPLVETRSTMAPVMIVTTAIVPNDN